MRAACTNIEVSCTIYDSSSEITYIGSWGPGGNSSEYNSTTHFAGSANQFFLFTFNGTQISVFGTVPVNDGSTPTTARYIVDSLSSPPQTFQPTQSILYQSNLFTSSPLANQQHTLTVFLDSVGAHYFFDFLRYDDGSTTNETTAPYPPSAIHSAKSLSPSTSASVLEQSTSTSTASSSTTSTSNHLTTILTAVFIPLCIILVAAIALLACYNKRRNRSANPAKGVYPFVYSPRHGELSGDASVPSSWYPPDQTSENLSSPLPRLGGIITGGRHKDGDEIHRDNGTAARLVLMNDAPSASGSEGQGTEAGLPAYESLQH